MVLEKTILWVDDEIQFMRAHILFLEEKGYNVLTATNGIDALEIVNSTPLHAVLLDEMMDGLDGLAVLEKIKILRPALPVVMITKNEEESLMEDAIGRQITDYLLKPISPSQVLMILKKNLEHKEITREATTQNYMSYFRDLGMELMEGVRNFRHWAEIHKKLSLWELEFDRQHHNDIIGIFEEQKREVNREFEKYVVAHYQETLGQTYDLPDSSRVLDEFVSPILKRDEKVLFILIDCMRFDQWMMIEPLLYETFNVDLQQHLSILPTATPYSRNTIFSGKYPDEIHKLYPDIYSEANLEESMNRYENELMHSWLKEKHISIEHGHKYIKILDSRQGDNFVNQFSDMRHNQFISLVINFVDILAHRRSESALLKEIVPDESSYRNIIRNWFSHSYLYNVIQKAGEYGFKIVITSDHGSVKVKKSATVKADRETSTGMRYKTGKNLRVDPKMALRVKRPADYRLPTVNINSEFIFTKDDYYFVYPNNIRKYQKQIVNTFQHGGISLDEMILPVAILSEK